MLQNCWRPIMKKAVPNMKPAIGKYGNSTILIYISFILSILQKRSKKMLYHMISLNNGANSFNKTPMLRFLNGFKVWESVINKGISAEEKPIISQKNYL